MKLFDFIIQRHRLSQTEISLAYAGYSRPTYTLKEKVLDSLYFIYFDLFGYNKLSLKVRLWKLKYDLGAIWPLIRDKVHVESVKHTDPHADTLVFCQKLLDKGVPREKILDMIAKKEEGNEAQFYYACWYLFGNLEKTKSYKKI